MNKAPLLLAGLVAGIFSAGDAAETAAADRAPRGRGHADESHTGWRAAKADDGRTVPVRSYASWSRAYARAGEGRAGDDGGGHGFAVYGPGPGWRHGGEGAHLADPALGLAPFGALGAADYPRGCPRTRWDPGVGYARVRARRR